MITGAAISIVVLFSAGIATADTLTASSLGNLAKSSGSQNYVAPSSIDASKYNEIYIWCKQYAVPLGVAALK